VVLSRKAEVAALLAAARGGVDAHAEHALALADEVAHRDAPLEPEAGEAPRLRNQQLEERGLRDHARPRRAQVLRTHAEDPPGAAEDVERLDARLRERVERGAEAHRAEGLDAARHETLAPELAREVGLALEEGHAEAAAGEEVGERRAGGAGAGDHDVGHGRGFSPPRAPMPPAA